MNKMAPTFLAFAACLALAGQSLGSEAKRVKHSDLKSVSAEELIKNPCQFDRQRVFVRGVLQYEKDKLHRAIYPSFPFKESERVPIKNEEETRSHAQFVDANGKWVVINGTFDARHNRNLLRECTYVSNYVSGHAVQK
jgi:hypothetical protein